MKEFDMGKAVGYLSALASAVLKFDAYQATKYLGPKLVVRATRRNFRTRSKRDRRVEILFTIGEPNYREREFIRQCGRAGEPLPIKKIQLRTPKPKGK